MEMESTTSISSKALFKWPHDLVVEFIGMIADNYTALENGIKRQVFVKIANELSRDGELNLTWDQCENKWKGLKRQYKAINIHNSRIGNAFKVWPYYEMVHEIIEKSSEYEVKAEFSDNSAILETNETASFSEIDPLQDQSPSRYSVPVEVKTETRRPTKRKIDNTEQIRNKNKRKQLQLMERYVIAIEHIAEKLSKDD